MVGYIKRTYPQTQLIVVGFSLGGNIVCKFLGENMVNQERVLCCVSICQGYSALRWVSLSWQHSSPSYYQGQCPEMNSTSITVHQASHATFVPSANVSFSVLIYKSPCYKITFKCNQQSTGVRELVFVADALYSGSMFYLIYHWNVLNSPECHTLSNSVYRLCYSHSLFLTKDLGACRAGTTATVS